MTSMWRVMLTVAILASCGGESTSGDPMVDAGSGSNSDGGTDASPGPYAPCPTCCDPVTQTGCPTGQACYLTTSPLATYCAPVGAMSTGGMCNADSDCSAGTDCNVGFTDRCHKFCAVDADCPPGMTRCLLTQPFGEPPESRFGLCMQ